MLKKLIRAKRRWERTNSKNKEEENKSVTKLKDAEIVHEEAMEGESERPGQEDNKIEVKKKDGENQVDVTR